MFEARPKLDPAAWRAWPAWVWAAASESTLSYDRQKGLFDSLYALFTSEDSSRLGCSGDDVCCGLVAAI